MPPADRLAARVRRLLLGGVALRRRAAATLSAPLAAAAAEIAARLSAGGAVYFFGNGGSASQAQHFAAELTGRFKRERPGLAAVAVGANAGELTSIANDYAYAECFERPVLALVRPGDAAVGLSGSGGSENVARALAAARRRGAFALAFTGAARGAAGGPVGRAADLALVVPSRQTAEVQELHLALGHALCELIEELAAGGADGGRPARRR